MCVSYGIPLVGERRHECSMGLECCDHIIGPLGDDDDDDNDDDDDACLASSKVFSLSAREPDAIDCWLATAPRTGTFEILTTERILHDDWPIGEVLFTGPLSVNNQVCSHSLIAKPQGVQLVSDLKQDPSPATMARNVYCTSNVAQSQIFSQPFPAQAGVHQSSIATLPVTVAHSPEIESLPIGYPLMPSPRKQGPRFQGDLYTAPWVRGEGAERSGWCRFCSIWFKLKDSAYWVCLRCAILDVNQADQRINSTTSTTRMASAAPRENLSRNRTISDSLP